MSKVYFISDLHFGHVNIPKFEGHNRGGVTTVQEHDDWIIKQWNSVVTKRDLTWVLGDVAFTKQGLAKVSKLNGSKHLILGNHDQFSLELYSQYFNKIHGFMKKGKFWLSHAPVHPNQLRNKYNIQGHVHSNTLEDLRYFNVSVEALNGMPIAYEELESIFKTREKYIGVNYGR